MHVVARAGVTPDGVASAPLTPEQSSSAALSRVLARYPAPYTKPCTVEQWRACCATVQAGGFTLDIERTARHLVTCTPHAKDVCVALLFAAADSAAPAPAQAEQFVWSVCAAAREEEHEGAGTLMEDIVDDVVTRRDVTARGVQLAMSLWRNSISRALMGPACDDVDAAQMATLQNVCAALYRLPDGGETRKAWAATLSDVPRCVHTRGYSAWHTSAPDDAAFNRVVSIALDNKLNAAGIGLLEQRATSSAVQTHALQHILRARIEGACGTVWEWFLARHSASGDVVDILPRVLQWTSGVPDLTVFTQAAVAATASRQVDTVVARAAMALRILQCVPSATSDGDDGCSAARDALRACVGTHTAGHVAARVLHDALAHSTGTGAGAGVHLPLPPVTVVRDDAARAALDKARAVLRLAPCPHTAAVRAVPHVVQLTGNVPLALDVWAACASPTAQAVDGRSRRRAAMACVLGMVVPRYGARRDDSGEDEYIAVMKRLRGAAGAGVDVGNLSRAVHVWYARGISEHTRRRTDIHTPSAADTCDAWARSVPCDVDAEEHTDLVRHAVWTSELVTRHRDHVQRAQRALQREHAARVAQHAAYLRAAKARRLARKDARHKRRRERRNHRRAVRTDDPRFYEDDLPAYVYTSTGSATSTGSEVSSASSGLSDAYMEARWYADSDGATSDTSE